VSPHAANWIELEGTVNVRDVGGLPTVDGRTVRPGVLIRSANLQHLTEADVTRLVDELGVRRVIDLRTDIEVSSQAPGPMHAHPGVTVRHLSLYPDDNRGESDLREPSDVLLPWHGEQGEHSDHGERGDHGEHGAGGDRDPAIGPYLRYLRRRPDSIVAALRTIAEPDGATLVHCAAGKDRTGMVIALALTMVGVSRELVAADYAHTQSRIRAIMAHLARSQLYQREVTEPELVPPASRQFMLDVLAAIDADFGGVPVWLAANGWTDADTARLRATLLTEQH
jgi:protein-tyrosine phosphatase